MADMIRLLVVDDYPELREQMRLLLAGHREVDVIGMAGDGLEAIELCAALNPDVVLLDAQMPEMDGFTATRLIREQFPHIRVVIMTGGYLGEDQRAAESGASAFLLKPAPSQRIIEVIQAVRAMAD